MHQGLEDMKLIVPYCHVLSGVLTNRTQRLTVLIDLYYLQFTSPHCRIALFLL
jgi:hypothetical protein